MLARLWASLWRQSSSGVISAQEAHRSRLSRPANLAPCHSCCRFRTGQDFVILTSHPAQWESCPKNLHRKCTHPPEGRRLRPNGFASLTPNKFSGFNDANRAGWSDASRRVGFKRYRDRGFKTDTKSPHQIQTKHVRHKSSQFPYLLLRPRCRCFDSPCPEISSQNNKTLGLQAGVTQWNLWWLIFHSSTSSIWAFPQMGVPLDHPFTDGILRNKNHPAIGVAPWRNHMSICHRSTINPTVLGAPGTPRSFLCSSSYLAPSPQWFHNSSNDFVEQLWKKKVWKVVVNHHPTRWTRWGKKHGAINGYKYGGFHL